MKGALSTVCLIVLVSGTVALADWDPGDPYKMHWPQMPDYTGWDIAMTDVPGATMYPVADDFLCTEDGPITQIHFWASVRQGEMPFSIDHIHLSLHADIPESESPTGYSMPGDELWSYDATVDDFTSRYVESEAWQGWFDPVSGDWNRPDHMGFYQYNVYIPLGDQYAQSEGTIYWLDIWIVSDLNQIIGTGPLGWKTTLPDDHWNDYAVFWDADNQQWQQIIDPFWEDPCDMAFVIVPEPGTMVLLICGAIGLLRRKC